MAKADKSGRSKGEGRYVSLRHWLLDSAAWHSLSAGARAVYVMLSQRYAGPGSNNGSIPLSVREVVDELRVGKATAHGYFRELQERGFIEVVIRGTFTRKDRRATEWRLDEYPCDLSGDLPAKKVHALDVWKEFHGSVSDRYGISSRTERYLRPNRAAPNAV